MTLSRQRQGLETAFDRRTKLQEKLTKFLIIHENMRSLDIDCCTIFDKHPDKRTRAEKFLMEELECGKCYKNVDKEKWEIKKYNRHGSAFLQGNNVSKYKNKQCEAWEQILEEIEEFLEMTKNNS